jgi:hypothetical protein
MGLTEIRSVFIEGYSDSGESAAGSRSSKLMAGRPLNPHSPDEVVILSALAAVLG